MKDSAVNKISTEKVKKIWTAAFSKETEDKKENDNLLLVVCLIINISIAFLAFCLSYFKIMPPEVPILFGSPDGEGQLVNSYFLSMPAVTAGIFVLINMALTYFVKDDFLKKGLFVTSISLTLLSSVTVIKVINLLGNI